MHRDGGNTAGVATSRVQGEASSQSGATQAAGQDAASAGGNAMPRAIPQARGAASPASPESPRSTPHVAPSAPSIRPEGSYQQGGSHQNAEPTPSVSDLRPSTPAPGAQGSSQDTGHRVSVPRGQESGQAVTHMPPILRTTPVQNPSTESEPTNDSTRVMSPRDDDQNFQLAAYRPYTDLLLVCDLCKQGAHELFVCGLCHVAGHRHCLRPGSVRTMPDYIVCEHCLPWAIDQASRAETQHQRLAWGARLSASMASWRQTALSASGVAATLGVTVGATGAAIVGGVTAFAAGTLQGASSSFAQRAPSGLNEQRPGAAPCTEPLRDDAERSVRTPVTVPSASSSPFAQTIPHGV